MNSNRILSATIVPVFHLFSALICIFFSNELVNKIYFEDYSDVAYFLSMSIGVYSLYVCVIVRSIFVYSKDMYLKFIPILFSLQFLLTVSIFYIFYFYNSQILFFAIIINLSILILYLYEFKSTK